MRQYTEEEVREKLLTHIWAMIDYWTQVKQSHNKSTREVVAGAMFSVLATLDGGSAELPAFIVAPCPHPEDKEYYQQNGENWFPENHTVDVQCDLGPLHETFHRYDPQRE